MKPLDVVERNLCRWWSEAFAKGVEKPLVMMKPMPLVKPPIAVVERNLLMWKGVKPTVMVEWRSLRWKSEAYGWDEFSGPGEVKLYW